MPRAHLIAVFATLLPVSAAINDPVRLDNGLISGLSGSNPDVRVFKGIPFAVPPVGDLRWRAPKMAAAWDGVRKADRFSATCMQTPYPEGSLYRGAPQPVSEDLPVPERLDGGEVF